MTKRTISFVQPNFQQGPKEFNAYYLPYSAGVILSYAMSFEHIKNSWTVDVPYDGYYGFKGTADNIGKLFVDGQKIIDLEGFRTTNPKVVKKFIKKGKHTIEVEVFNQPEMVRTIGNPIRQQTTCRTS